MDVRPGLLIVENDHILLMKYNYGEHTVFMIPGGNPEGLERIEETLERELKEELGIEIEVGKLVLLAQGIKGVKNIPVLHCIFISKKNTGIPQVNPLKSKALSCQWLPIKELGNTSVILYPNIGSYLSDIWEKDEGSVITYISRIDQPWL